MKALNFANKRTGDPYTDATKLIGSVYGRFSDNVDGKYSILACDNDWLVAQLDNISEFCNTLKKEICNETLRTLQEGTVSGQD